MNSIVVAVFNKSELTKACLDSVFQNSSAQTREIIIIDNNSTDDTAAVLKVLHEKFVAAGWTFKIFRNAENVGYGRAMNQGFREVKSSFVTFLNNDTWLMPGWDQALLSAMENRNLDMVAPFVDENPFDAKMTAMRAAVFVKKNAHRFRVDWNPIVMIFQCKSFARVGLFDERFFLTYEDTDLRERMNREGLKYGQTGACFIWHKSQGTRKGTSIPPDYEIKSKKLFIEKWGFDPTRQEAGPREKFKRRWKRWRNRWGYL